MPSLPAVVACLTDEEAKMSPTIRHYVRLIGGSLALMAGVLVVVFVLLELAPGDPIQALVGGMPVTDEYRAALNKEYGLDQPVYVRFANYVANVLAGNLGVSYANNMPVAELVMARLGNTLILTIPALIIAAIGGVIIGALAARTRSRIVDASISYAAIALFSVPTFWLAILLIMLFSVHLGWLPAQGMAPVGQSGVSLDHMVLPVISLACMELAYFVRVMRSSTVEVLGQDYIDTARSKGLSSNRVLRLHALPNAMLPMVSVIGFAVGTALAGSVLVEKVFAWPGVGLLMYDSIARSENMVIMAILLITSVLVIIVNIATDVVYGFVDPRVRARMRRQRAGS